MESKLKGDFRYSIGEVLSIADYEQMMYDIKVRAHSEEPKNEDPEPVQAKEESLDSLRESSHG